MKVMPYLAFQFDLLVIGVWHVPLREPGLASVCRTRVSKSCSLTVRLMRAVFYSLPVLY